MNDSLSRTLLLVEDDPSDALQFSELLRGARSDYRILHADSVAGAVKGPLRDVDQIDVVILDLGLPDCRGVAAVQTVREHGRQTPIVVLTGSEDEVLAHACLDAGAQDYLCKADVRTLTLERAIGYAISRVREAQVRELSAVLAGYRALSSASQTTAVTAALSGSGAIMTRRPEQFTELVAAYLALLDPYLTPGTEPDRDAMQHLVTRLGDLAAGPRDLLDVHVAALERWIGTHERRARASVLEARLLALQMMGLLVDYYRVGQRWRFTGEPRA